MQMCQRCFALALLVACTGGPHYTYLAPDAAIDAVIDTAIDAGPTQVFPSCAALPRTCGPARNDSCCNSLTVSGGTYFRSYDVAGDASSGNASYPATVSTFRLDKYEVTVGRFRAFVQAGMGTRANPPVIRAGAHANIAGSGWDTSWNANLPADQAALIAAIKCDSTFQMWTDTPAGDEDRPMNCLSWSEAMAFCAWDGGYLPTEAEWNYVAAGGDEQRAYPWSNPAGSLALDSLHAGYWDGMNCVADGTAGCAATDVLAAGTRPEGVGRWGQLDLASNVGEWTLDWYADYLTPCMDCANLSTATYRSFRGGYFSSIPFYLRAGSRNAVPPEKFFPGAGVRCARSAP